MERGDIAIAAIICLAFIGRLEGVREASVFAVGNIIKVYNRIYGKITERIDEGSDYEH